jgi:ribosome-associated toxin RatA of RatAB toxin-antitoxin module
MSAQQSAAQIATNGLQQAGIEARVVGPFDEHSNTVKVLRDLQTGTREHAARGGKGSIRLTPKRFVRFMREAERKKRFSRQRDPIEHYVDSFLQNGKSLTGMGASALERKLYTDMARIICFAFDRAVMSVNGMDIWGHELLVKAKKEPFDGELRGRSFRSVVGVHQVEAIVDKMLRKPSLRAPDLMAGMQKQLMMNCCVLILQLIEDLTSQRHMQINVLGHSLHIKLEPCSLDQLQAMNSDAIADVKVNERAIDQLVDALLQEGEIQLVLVPDIIEAEVYRYVLHKMMCIAQFILSQLKVRLFGVEVQLSLVAEEDPDADVDEERDRRHDYMLDVPEQVLQDLADKIEIQRHLVERELKARRGESDSTAPRRSSLEEPRLLQDEEEPDNHVFERMAVQDRLARCLAIQRTVPVDIDVAFGMVSGIDDYPQWMPFCTDARVLLQEEGSSNIHCEVGFGLETGTALGTVGDTIRYRIALKKPQPEPSGMRSARVVADATEGFTYGKRLVYDWRFVETSPGETDVKLNMFFQARNFFFLPLWDSMQVTITSVMMKKFNERAAVLSPRTSGASSSPQQVQSPR